MSGSSSDTLLHLIFVAGSLTKVAASLASEFQRAQEVCLRSPGREGSYQHPLPLAAVYMDPGKQNSGS